MLPIPWLDIAGLEPVALLIIVPQLFQGQYGKALLVHHLYVPVLGQ
jgi:hypothetical protein